MKKALGILTILVVVFSAFPTLLARASSTYEPVLRWVEGTDQVIINDELYVANRWPQWLKFEAEVEEGGGAVMEMKFVILPDEEGNAYFHFKESLEPEGWYGVPDEFDRNKNPTAIYFRCINSDYWINEGETKEFGVSFILGPSSCRYNFAIYTIGLKSTTKKDLYVCIDNVPPTVHEVWFEPDDHPPDNVFKNAQEVQIYANVNDDDVHPSGVKRVVLYLCIKETDPTCAQRHGPWDMEPIDVDPYGNGIWGIIVKWDTHLWDSERWYTSIVVAFDKVKNESPPKEGDEFFFCWELPTFRMKEDLQPETYKSGMQIHVRQEVDVEGVTGFTPDAGVKVYFNNGLVWEGTTNHRGKFNGKFEVPEVPRGIYTVYVEDAYKNKAEKRNVEVIPWVEPGYKTGFVGDKVTITGVGFKENTAIDVIYRDVWKGDVYEETVRERNATHVIEWKPHLDNEAVKSTTSNAKGSFSVEIEVPECYGGLHPVFAQEKSSAVRSNNSVFFHVYTSIWVDPPTGLAEQYVTLYSSGLPLPHYSLKMETWNGGWFDPTIYNERDWCLALDFGPRSHWLWEDKCIINGFFDSDWFEGEWWPVSYACTSDPASPVWSGRLCWRDCENEYHLGCPFIKVPVLPAGDYEIRLYQFGVNDGVNDDKAKDGIDHYEYQALTSFVVKDRITSSGDVNGDGVTNSSDITATVITLENWNQAADVNNDGIVDIFDVALVARARAFADMNEDGVVDVFDAVLMAKAFSSQPGDSNWNQAADLNNDDVVDIFDVVLIAESFGKTLEDH